MKGEKEMYSKLTVNDIPVVGKFKIIRFFFGKEILHTFDGSGSGDISPDVAFREVVSISAEDDYTIIEVF